MSKQDQIKWDKKYTEKQTLLDLRPPSDKLVSIIGQIRVGPALDLASGNGRHTIYLTKNGFEVDAVDISQISIDSLAKRLSEKNLSEKVNLIRSDLDDYTPPTEHFDLIIMSNFLDRDLIERSKNALKSGGIFFVETYMDDPSNEKSDSNPDFLLKKGELINIFSDDFEILLYEEFDNESYEIYRMKKQMIAAKKIF